MELALKHKIGIFIMFILITVIAWYQFLYIPKGKEIKKIKEEIRSIQQQHDSILEQSFSQVFKKKEEQEAFIKYKGLTAQLPKREEISSILNQIISLGEERNISVQILPLKISNLKIEEKDETKIEYKIDETTIDFVLQGDFFAIGEFLSDLIRLPFFSRYVNITMETKMDIYPKINSQISSKLFILNNLYASM